MVNLEGCGNSGKAILFQVGEGRLIEAYSAVPYPLATVAVRTLDLKLTFNMSRINKLESHKF